MKNIGAKKIKRIVVFGGTSAAFFFISRAIESGFEVILITTPFRLSAKIDNKITFREALSDLNVTLIEISGNLTKDILEPYVNENTIGISIVTFWIFNDEIIKLFKGYLFNYHGALLPEEKGGGTFTHKILSKSYDGGLNIHRIDLSIDSGPIVLEKRFQFPKECKTTLDFEEFKHNFEKKLLNDFLSLIISGKQINFYPQKNNDSFYFPLLNTKINGVIDWSWKCSDIDIFIKAFDDPYDGASTRYKNKLVHLKGSEVISSERKFHPFQNGIIINKDDKGIYIASIGGILKVQSFFDENNCNITDNLSLGERLYSPTSMIENSMQEKARYGPLGLKNNVD